MGEEVPGSAAPELDRGEPPLLLRIDDRGSGMRSSQHSASVAVHSFRAHSVVSSELIFSKIHHQVSLAIRHDSFQRGRKVRLVIMERLDERCQER